MHVFTFRTLREFWEQHPDAEGPLRMWHTAARRETWTGMADIKRSFGNASVIDSKRAVFNIGGNKYRLIVRIDFDEQLVFVRFIGTHKEYDRIDARSV